MLDVFPNGGLTSSIITTVWVGIWVVALMNLRFGTPLSGLVVPGYLVPLFIIKPTTGFIILLEALITYLLARTLGHHIPRKFRLPEMFGRDRFFIIVLSSVLVRVLFDGYLLPEIATTLSLWDITFSWSNHLYSLGLVIIALTANVFWNGGIKYGSIVVGSQLIISFLIVLYLLTPLTNFSLTNLSILYDDIAISIIAGPKAYIILLITAFIASQLNLRYGWEFNGILIPALLALQLFNPEKLLVTLLETLVIYVTARSLLSSPLLKRYHIEGARELLLFFNISFVLKILSGFIIASFWPEEKVNDYYGFGYLLSSLIALKMYQRGRLAQIIGSTTQTTIIGGGMAIIIGFLIHTAFLDNSFIADKQFIHTNKNQTIASNISLYRAKIYRTIAQETTESLTLQQKEALVGAIHYFQKASILADSEAISQGIGILRSNGFTVKRLQDNVLSISSQNQSIPLLMFYRLNIKSDLLFTVPYPINEKTAADLANLFFSLLPVKMLFLDSEERFRDKEYLKINADSLLTRLIDRYQYSAVQFRFSGNYTQEHHHKNNENQLFVTGKLDQSVPIKLWKSLLPELEINWGASRLTSVLSENKKEFSELVVNIEGARHLMGGALDNVNNENSTLLKVQQFDIRHWLEDFLDDLPDKGSQKYRRWNSNELILWNIEAIQPILSLRDQFIQGSTLAELTPQLSQVNFFLARYKYEVIHVTDDITKKTFLLLRPAGKDGLNKGWGLYFFSLEDNGPYYVQSPHPIFERGTELFGYDLAQILHAKAFLMAGAHPLTYADGRADILEPKNKHSLFNLVHQGLISHYTENPELVVQIRSHKRDLGVTAPTILSFRHKKLRGSHTQITNSLINTLTQSGLNPIDQDGRLLTAGLEVGDSAQSRFLRFSNNTEMAALWLPSDLLSSFLFNSFSKLAMLSPESKLPTNVEIFSWLKTKKWVALSKQETKLITEQIENFQYDKNILQLSKIPIALPLYEWKINLESDSELYLLSLENKQGALAWVLNPSTFHHGISQKEKDDNIEINKMISVLSYRKMEK